MTAPRDRWLIGLRTVLVAIAIAAVLACIPQVRSGVSQMLFKAGWIHGEPMSGLE
jgi:hypothetical protein